VGTAAVCLQAVAQRTVPETGAALSNSALSARNWYDYFPLAAGNEWIYSDGTSTYSVQVLRETVEANRVKYFEVSGYFPNDPAGVRKLRRDAMGQVLEFNPNGADFLWYRFGLFRGAWVFETGEQIACISGSRVSVGGYGEVLEIPLGIKERTLRLDFQSPCADAGISSENFAAGLGLVQRVMNTIAGPKTWRLIAANLGSRLYPLTPYGVEVAIDRPVYYNNLMPPIVRPWPTMRARLTIRNLTNLPVEFTFPTSQRFDFIVRDAKGTEILRWSDGKAFAMVMGSETLANGWRSYPVEIVLRTRDGRPLPAGSYSVIGYLTTRGSESGLFGTAGVVTFEVRDVH
jgi:hypothetical protein